MSYLRRLQVLLSAVAVAIAAGCASNKPQTPQQAATPPPPPEPVKAQESTPLERATIKTELAGGYYERGQFDVAIEVLEEAQKLAPNYPKIYDIYGLVYTMLGDNPKAEASFRRALGLAPNDPEIRANYGAFLCATGKQRESIPEFEAAIADPLFKKPEIALINAGKCTWALGDAKKADEYFRKAMGVSPGNTTAAYQLALLAYREGRWNDARFWLRPVMQQGTPRPEALYLGVCVERKLSDRQAELSYTSQLRNRYPDSAEAKQVGGSCE